MGFALGRGFPEVGCGGATGPDDGKGDERHQEGEFARMCQAGVLDVQASSFGVTEHAFDGPAFAAGWESLTAWDVGHDDQPLALETLCGEVEERGVVGLGALARAHARPCAPERTGSARRDGAGRRG